jgi:hypothetical protein
VLKEYPLKDLTVGGLPAAMEVRYRVEEDRPAGEEPGGDDGPGDLVEVVVARPGEREPFPDQSRDLVGRLAEIGGPLRGLLHGGALVAHGIQSDPASGGRKGQNGQTEHFRPEVPEIVKAGLKPMRRSGKAPGQARESLGIGGQQFE